MALILYNTDKRNKYAHVIKTTNHCFICKLTKSLKYHFEMFAKNHLTVER